MDNRDEVPLAWLCTSGWPAGDEHEAVEQIGWDFLHFSAARRRSEAIDVHSSLRTRRGHC